MRLTTRERQRVAAITAPRYQRAQKKHKGIILNEFIGLTGYSRCYASYVLRAHGKKVRVTEDMVVEGDIRRRAKRKKVSRYSEVVRRVEPQL